MAAYAALTSLINTIHQIQHYTFPPIALNIQQVESLAEHVTFLEEFLENYKSPAAYGGDEADPLEMRIATAAYAAEDAIESYVVHIIQSRCGSTSTPPQIDNLLSSQMIGSPVELHPVFNFLGFLMKAKNNWMENTEVPRSPYQALWKSIKDMKSIKKDVMKMKKKKTAVVEAHVSASGTVSSSRSSIMVGQDDAILEVLHKLTDGRPNRHVIPIVGMGGIGKTTLARNIFEHALVKDNFDICAWATISQQYNTVGILCELLSQANKKSKDELSYMSEGELVVELHKYLSHRRFLIVLDDMWSIEAWEKIQHSFTDSNNSSRIVVTTRLSSLGSQLDSNYSLEMKFLDLVSSWDLFSESVFGEEGCPVELEEIGKEIVENCRGLPLSIVVVGGLLKKLEHTKQCWESIRENSTSVVLNSENEDFCSKILKMSYTHLPVHLKPCFLHMGVFEEDRAVRVSTLVKLWVSEGFLKPVSDKSSEMIAKEYLNDLVERNLIIAHELGSTGSIKYCRLHDLLRDLCLREAGKEGFYSVIGRNEFQGLHRERCIVIPGSTSKEEVHDALQCRLLARSLICETGCKDVTRYIPEWAECALLRTLKAYDRDTSGSHDNFLPEVLKCVNLRYLAVGVRQQDKFPSSVGLLWNLQTLIVYCSNRVIAPDVIWKMPQLRHVEFHKGCLFFLPPPSGNIVPMENLQTLKGIAQLSCDEASKIIPNIKKLGVLRRIIPSNLICLSRLESFRCWNIFYMEKYCTFPYSLKHLSLGSDSSHWELNQGLLDKIGALPLLQKLKLERARFQTSHLKLWETSEDQFPSLKFLKLKWCLLDFWMTESSHFPRLEKLHICGSKELDEIPSEIGEIPTLQSILLEYCSESVVVSAKNITEEQDEIQVRVVLFNNDNNQALRRSLTSTPKFLVEIFDF